MPPPERVITVNQLIAHNMSTLRRAAGFTQEELGARMGGWSAASVSAAERSWDGRRVKKFDADELALIAAALSVPVVALFLPPEDDGETARYLIRAGEDDKPLLTTTGLMRLVYPDNDDDTEVMGTYRDRWNAVMMRLFGDDPNWATLIARWLADSEAGRAERAASLRERRDELLRAAARAAAELGDLADAIESNGDASRSGGAE